MAEHISLTGDKELLSYFRKLGTEGARDTVRAVLNDTSREVVKIARSKRSGKIGKTIKAEADGPSSRKIGPTRSGWYGIVLERGTSERTTRARTDPKRFAHSTGSLPKQPFMEPSIRDPRVEATARKTFKKKMREWGAQ